MFNELEALTTLLSAPEEHNGRRGDSAAALSSLTPADLARIGRENVKAPSKVGPDAASSSSSTAIWDEAEIQSRSDAADGADDGRCRPEYEILFGQHVGTEDVYLGMSDKTPSSIHADRMVVRILLKGERMADIDLDVTEQKSITNAVTLNGTPKKSRSSYLYQWPLQWIGF